MLLPELSNLTRGKLHHCSRRRRRTSVWLLVGDNRPANSSYDLKIVPAVPQFRNWNITIACDNGTSTQTTDYF
jgi:hypothetical protein